MELLNYFPYIGLVLDVIGAWLLWRFGITATIDHPEFNAVMEEAVVGGGPNYDQIVRDSKKQIMVVKKWSKLGLGLLMLGFVLQIIGSISSSATIGHLSKQNSLLVSQAEVYDSELKEVHDKLAEIEGSVLATKNISTDRYEAILKIYNHQKDEISTIRNQVLELESSYPVSDESVKN
ncbi:hypothetical protein LZU85_20130 [Vibrio sp. IRLE0018]|uniref:hypothetical protein n=1 Tax=Vibrio floridensis TaxID=2908007 RepID=UPI001F28008F|nr:hypothetical protein [Vibrio floridensis]MCF8781111.1 hypothetical protein [Vibrio floridensis]